MMRCSIGRGSAIALAAASLSFFSASARAETLRQDAELHSRPTARSEAIAILGAGMPVVVLERPYKDWTLISGGGFQGYVRSADIAPFNPWCTQGYPYSGSERYFQMNLIPVRTGPLGFLFGYHVSDPC